MRTGIGSHQSAKMRKDEWLTPPALIGSLGKFDLDPCSPIDRPWDTAEKHYTTNDDGLWQPWSGRVWLNPPYGQFTGDWLHKLSDHGNGIALVFARTETEDWVRYIWEKADGILFLHGRLYFHHKSGLRASANSGAPSALIAYGYSNVEALSRSNLPGSLIWNWSAN